MFRIHFIISLLLGTLISSAMAAIGIGLHWGNDFSLRMESVENEQLSFANLKLDTSSIGGTMPSELTEISGKNLPIFINRTDWTRTPFDIGGKLYIDIIPFIDVIELGANFGWWEYIGTIKYPTSVSFKENVDPTMTNSPEELFDVTYATLPITLREFDMGFLGLQNTPYMKLHFDLTVRKYIFQIPKTLKTIRFYGGAGASLHFATPILNKNLIEDALGEVVNSTKSIEELGSDIFNNEDVSKAILEKIISSMMTPHWGCHLSLGAMIKLPVLPLGFYIDGKLMIPFDNMDEHVDLGGFGFLLNSGISLSF